MKLSAKSAGAAGIDAKEQLLTHRFLNMTYDAHVHGAYETTMELCDPFTGHFFTGGHPDPAKLEEFIEAVFLKLHEVVIAIEFTAALPAHASVFEAARAARRSMDALPPWKKS